MTQGRPQILRYGQELTTRTYQVAHSGGDLLARFSQSEDEVGLGDEAGTLGCADHVERPFIAEAGPNPPKKPRDRFQVVGQHLWTAIENLRE